MRFTTHINNQKCLEWGFTTLAQGALFDLLNQASSWAQAHYVDGKTLYWVSRSIVVEQLPLAYKKEDTVYRTFKEFAEKGLIEYIKHDEKDLICLTEKGKEWNSFTPSKSSDCNPDVGLQSDDTRISIRKGSDLNPTDKYINNKYINNKNTSSLQAATPTKLKAKFTDEDLKCAQWIFGLVKKLIPTAKQPTFDSWARDIRLIRERDGRTHREICELFLWANQDSFWAANVLSPSKLREKWNQLEAKRKSKSTPSKIGWDNNPFDFMGNCDDLVGEVITIPQDVAKELGL